MIPNRVRFGNGEGKIGRDADLRGEPHAPYLTFSDSARYQRIAESIRGVY